MILLWRLCNASFPPICLTNCISLDMIVTHFACITHMLLSSKRHTRYTAAASCNTRTALAWTLSHDLSLSTLKNGSFGVNSSVDFWNLWICLSVFVPGLNFHTLVFFLSGIHGSFLGTFPDLSCGDCGGFSPPRPPSSL